MAGRVPSLTMALVVFVSGCDIVFQLAGVPPDARPDAPPPPDHWASVSAGSLHTCGIHIDQTLWCWGRNDLGQLGTGATDVERDTQKQVDDNLWLMVAAGGRHTCGIRLDHSLWCWGENDNGELGVGDATSPYYVPQQVAGTWSTVSTGQDHTCAIDMMGTASCWGRDNLGEIGDGAIRSTGVTTPFALPDTWLAIATPDLATCGIKADHTLWCWGYNGDGGCGNPAAPFEGTTPYQVNTETSWTQLAAGGEFSCGLRSDGTIRCWGLNDEGELGDGTVMVRKVPTAVDQDQITDWIDIAAGFQETCARRSDHSLWCWGNNSQDQLATDTSSDRFKSLPTQTSGGAPPWLAMTVGDAHTCAIDSANQLWCAGSGGGGQLGTVGDGSRLAPVPITATAAVAGIDVTCGVDGSGALSCWGYNGDYNLGDNSFFDEDTPHPVNGATWTSVAVGQQACAIDDLHQLWCWGQNSNGGVGNGNANDQPTPQMLARMWASVAANLQTCAIDTSMHLSCWGDNINAQAGQAVTPTTEIIESPMAIPGTWTSVGTGSDFTCGIISAVLKCWGDNSDGELGVGSFGSGPTPQTPQPTALPLGTYDQLAVGGQHVCIHGTAQQWWCWGYNENGQLGDQTTTSRPTPFMLPDPWLLVAAGDSHTCGIAPDHTLWCWGANEHGQLGDGTLIERHEKEKIGTDTTWSTLSLGFDHTCGTKVDGTVWCWGDDIDGEIGDGKAWRAAFAMVH